MVECLLLDAPIDIPSMILRAGDPAAGGIAIFIGTVRSASPERRDSPVLRLEYEAYPSMATLQLRHICEEALAKYRAIHLLVQHRTGVLDVGEPAVAVVASTPHRAEAFDACRYVIEELKKRVPIWKKEVFEDGAEWVDAHP